MKSWFIAIALLIAGCSVNTSIPTDFPTPPPPAPAAAAPKIEFKHDSELETQFSQIATGARGRVGVAAVVLETGEAAMLNADEHFPMLSVYKLPIAMAVMERIRMGELDFQEKVAVTRQDFVRQGQASALRDKNPNGGEFTIRELIRLSLVESDGTASDVLLRLVGGPAGVQEYLNQIGVADMKIANSGKEISLDWETQYRNWTTPIAAVELLRSMRDDWNAPPNLPDEKEHLLHRFMRESTTGPRRLKGLLPEGTVIAHKTGTGGTRGGVNSATNDIGIIWLPNGNRLAIAVFISDSSADERIREMVIARVAKAAWERFGRTSNSRGAGLSKE